MVRVLAIVVSLMLGILIGISYEERQRVEPREETIARLEERLDTKQTTIQDLRDKIEKIREGGP